MRSEETLLLDMLIAARKIQVIGEAARLISETIKTEHPEVEWAKIAGMRNRVIHQYFRVDLVLVWDTIQEDDEPLIEHLQLLIPPDEESSNSEP